MENYLKMNDNFTSATEKLEPKINAEINKLREVFDAN
jgi:hypothetical protein